uniref:Protein phosphatase 1 regulatory subunit 15A/B C-terminal domain-containing protein n=1 Tax=Kryptolebias marmoratus TaxID=37003 RepID=A0A3Q3B7P2_KRYMA
MFRRMNNEGRFSDGQSSPSSARTAVTSIGLDSQESSWIGLLSRPALSLLRKLRPWSAAPAELGSSLISDEREFLKQLYDMIPLTQTGPPHPTVLWCQHHGATGPLEPGAGGSMPWLTAVSLRDSGTQSPGDKEFSQQTQIGSLSSVRTLLNQVLLIPQELQPVRKALVRRGSGEGGLWWGSLLREEESSQGGLRSELSRPEGGTETEQLCPAAAAGTKVPPAETSPVLEWMLGEDSGPPDNKSHHTVQNVGVCTVDPLNCAQGGQDLGYSSLEEELSQRGLLSLMWGPAEEQDPQTPEIEEEQTTPEEDRCGGATVLSAPQCQNKTIAFIMGCPCSDDSQSESNDEDEDASDSDSEPDSESERLWTSLCQTVDPYNPRNFTARLQTGRTPPRTSPTPSPQVRSNTAPQTPVQVPASSPEYKKEEAEDRLDSGFSEAPPSASTGQSCRKSKKVSSSHFLLFRTQINSPLSSCQVRFCDDVDEFFASCGEEEEDRRGPWEELARDRCRFLRRCEEVEQSIGYCLDPQHRRRVFQRLNKNTNIHLVLSLYSHMKRT